MRILTWAFSGVHLQGKAIEECKNFLRTTNAILNSDHHGEMVKKATTTTAGNQQSDGQAEVKVKLEHPVTSTIATSPPKKAVTRSSKAKAQVKVKLEDEREKKPQDDSGERSAATKSQPEAGAPPDWELTWANLKKTRQKFRAPVDSMGCDQAHDRQDKDVNQRFQVLLSLMLSSQTKDPITWAAVQRLKDKGLGNVEAMMGAKEKDIEELIYPVGFYHRKAIYLKKVAAILQEKYHGDIPKTIKELCELPGVGPKMAHLCMLEAWNIVTGIGVDTHVHRIAARLKWVPEKGIKTPEDTRKALESWLPRPLWSEINHLLVGLGQTVCSPVGPKCHDCYNNLICPFAAKQTTKSPIKASRRRKVKVEYRDDDLEEEAKKSLAGDGQPGKAGSVASRKTKRTKKIKPE